MSVALPFQPLMAPVADEDRMELDEEVLHRCQRRDPQALRLWVSRYEKPVFAFLSRALGSGPHVEDLAQEVFVRAFAALDRFDPRGSARLTTWMLAIAWRVAQEARRKRAVPPMDPEDAARFVHDPGTPEQGHARQEIARAFERAALQLPSEQLDAFVLAEFHGLTMSEVADVLGVPEATAKTRLFRAREKLRKLLAPIREA